VSGERLSNKVALITGGAGGFGVAQARLFAAEGAAVAIADLAEDAGQALASEIVVAGGRAIFVRLDVTNEDSWAAAVDDTVARLGPPTVLVQNAGIYVREPIAEATVEQWDKVMAVNAKGVFLGTRAVVSHMSEAGGGSIVNVSSTAGLVGSRITAAYNPSKAAVRMFTKSTALQFAAQGIRANSIHPGPADTEMLAIVYPNRELLESRASEVPMGRFGTAADIATAALFLASDESSYMTGAELVVDGGVTAH
jgi:3alpha(or 20beta)-hydroxysteroid dehydrogenase